MSSLSVFIFVFVCVLVFVFVTLLLGHCHYQMISFYFTENIWFEKIEKVAAVAGFIRPE